MNNLKKLSLFLSSCIIASATLFPIKVTANQITVRADEWYPFNGDPKSNTPGYMIETLQAIFEPLGHQINYRLMPWERSIKMVEKGSFDCVVGVIKSESPSLIYPNSVFGLDASHFYVHVDSDWTYQGIESLKGQRVGVIGGYEYGGAFDRFVDENPKSIKVIKSSNALERFVQLLSLKRVDVYIETPAVMQAKLQEMDMRATIKDAGKYDESQTDPEENNLYFACTPQKETSKTYVQQFDDGLKKLRESGELQRILEKYGMTDWQ